MKDISILTLSSDIEEFKKKLQKGGDIDAVDRYKRTILMYAAADAKPEFVELILKYNTNINLQDTNGWTALHFAAQSRSTEIAKMLIDSGAKVDIPEVHGNTPLSIAVFNSKGEGDLIKLLLSSGADPNKKNNYGVSPLNLAKSIANYNVAKFFEN